MADERKYYVICDANCRFEGMTKEQILAAIAQAIQTGEIKDVDTGFVTAIKEQNSGASLKIWIGTQAEYNANAESIPANTFCIITDDTTAEDINAAIVEMRETITAQDEVLQKLNSRIRFELIDPSKPNLGVADMFNFVGFVACNFNDYYGIIQRSHFFNIGYCGYPVYDPLNPPADLEFETHACSYDAVNDITYKLFATATTLKITQIENGEETEAKFHKLYGVKIA